MRSGERGAVAVVIAIVIAVLLGFLALSLETGHVLSARGELQNGADAAALAGAKRLNGTNKNFELAGARADATNYSRANPTDKFDVEPESVELGRVEANAADCAKYGGTAVGTPKYGRQFCAITGTTAADAANITAVRVVTARTGSPGGAGGGAVSHPFGAFVGQSQTSVRAEAIALSGSPCNEGCPELPFAVKASCVESGGVPSCDGGNAGLFYIGLGNSGVDTGGFTVFQKADCGGDTGTDYGSGTNWGKPQICNVLANRCDNSAVVGDCISIKNGSNINANCGGGDGSICEILATKVGSVAQVPLVEWSEGETCGGGWGDFNYVHAGKIVRIGSVRLVGAMCKKNVTVLPGYEAAMGPCLTAGTTNGQGYANFHCFVLEFTCGVTDDDQTSVGCSWSGTAPMQPVLVR